MTRFTAARPAPGYLELVYQNPPFNMLDDDTVSELDEVVGILEEDGDLRVAVFRSANPDFFMARYDVRAAGVGDPVARLHPFAEVTRRLAEAP